MSTILVFAEQQSGVFKKAGFEVVSQARKLAEESGANVVAVAIGSGIEDQAGVLGEYGADKILLADDEKLENYNPETYKNVFVNAARDTEADILLFSATTTGKDLAPRVAAAMDTTLASDCIGIGLSDGKLNVNRPLYAGKVFAHIVIEGNPQIASLRPNVFEAVKSREGQNVSVEKMELPDLSSKINVVEVRRSGGDKLDVSEAEIIVTGGRGVRGPEHFDIIEELANSLGAAVGATRAAVDAGWRPHEDQVGQTGKVVSPNLYIMCGASGAIQHWAGMSGSKCIVAINKDENAPIMKKADYSIIGDLFEVVPVMTEEIKKFRE